MEYGKIISVTGMPGLYELLSSKNDGAIVRSLDDKTTKFVSSRIHNFSHLESIEIYTVRDNVNLVEVFQAMEKSDEKIPDGKNADVLKKYFESVYPDIDFERVYTSDLKKMAKWLQVLKSNEVEIKLTEAPMGDAAAENEETVTAEEVADKPAPSKAARASKTDEAPEADGSSKAASKKGAGKEKKETAPEDIAEAPKKKTTPKAKTESADEGEAKEPVKKKAAPKKKS
jgi:uncharacterized protein DUF6852/uncharacterized protein DUF5606